MRRYRLPYLIAGIVLAGTAAGAENAATTTAATGGFPTFNFDLRSRTATGILPFDQRFNVRAKVDTSVIKGTLRFIDSTGSSCDCDEKRFELPATEKCRLEKDKIPETEGPVVKNLTSNDLDELLFSVDSLLPNREYCFFFKLTKKLDATQIGDLRRSARPVITQALGGHTKQLTAEQRTTLRKNIGTLLSALAKSRGESLDLSIKSAFHPETTDEQAQAFNKTLLSLTQADSNANAFANNFCKNRKTALEAALKALKDDAPARTLLMSIESARAANEKVVAAIDDAAETALTSVLERRFEAALRDEVCSSLGELTQVADIEAPLASVQEVRAQFERVVRLADTLLSKAELAKAIGVDTPAKADAAKKARDILENARALIQSLESRLSGVGTAIRARQAAFEDMVEYVEAEGSETASLFGTSTGSFTTRHGWYVSMDVGLGSAPELEEAFTYAGLNFYFRPINKEAPLRAGQDQNFRRRFSLTLGMTLQSLQKANAYGGVIGDKAIVTAAGLRVLDSVKLVGGTLVIREQDRNPLGDRSRLAITPFVAISIDWDVRDTLGKLGTGLGIPQ